MIGSSPTGSPPRDHESREEGDWVVFRRRARAWGRAWKIPREMRVPEFTEKVKVLDQTLPRLRHLADDWAMSVSQTRAWEEMTRDIPLEHFDTAAESSDLLLSGLPILVGHEVSAEQEGAFLLNEVPLLADRLLQYHGDRVKKQKADDALARGRSPSAPKSPNFSQVLADFFSSDRSSELEKASFDTQVALNAAFQNVTGIIGTVPAMIRIALTAAGLLAGGYIWAGLIAVVSTWDSITWTIESFIAAYMIGFDPERWKKVIQDSGGVPFFPSRYLILIGFIVMAYFAWNRIKWMLTGGLSPPPPVLGLGGVVPPAPGLGVPPPGVVPIPGFGGAVSHPAAPPQQPPPVAPPVGAAVTIPFVGKFGQDVRIWPRLQRGGVDVTTWKEASDRAARIEHPDLRRYLHGPLEMPGQLDKWSQAEQGSIGEFNTLRSNQVFADNGIYTYEGIAWAVFFHLLVTVDQVDPATLVSAEFGQRRYSLPKEVLGTARKYNAKPDWSTSRAWLLCPMSDLTASSANLDKKKHVAGVLKDESEIEKEKRKAAENRAGSSVQPGKKNS